MYMNNNADPKTASCVTPLVKSDVSDGPFRELIRKVRWQMNEGTHLHTLYALRMTFPRLPLKRVATHGKM